MDGKNITYTIRQTDTRASYEGLRALWCKVFGDPPEFVDALYECLGGDVRGYAAEDETGAVRSALTCYRCGTFRSGARKGGREEAGAQELPDALDGRPVYVTYAVCTEPEFRGLGMAGALTEYVRDIVEASGGIPVVCPAEPGLEDYYEKLGYARYFGAAAEEVSAGDEEAADPEAGTEEPGWGEGAKIYGNEEDFEPFDPGFSVTETDAAVYNRYREKFLADIPHIELSDPMLALIAMDGTQFLLINGGDAVCALRDRGDHGTEGSGAGKGGRCAVCAELLVNPQLQSFSMEIGPEIASMLAEHFGAERIVYRTPVMPGQADAQNVYCQAMISAAGRPGDTDRAAESEAYFGFPVD